MNALQVMMSYVPGKLYPIALAPNYAACVH